MKPDLHPEPRPRASRRSCRPAWAAAGAALWLATSPAHLRAEETTLISLQQWSREYVTLSVTGWGVNSTQLDTVNASFNLGQVVNAPELIFGRLTPDQPTGLGGTNGSAVALPGGGSLQFFVPANNPTVAHTVAVACGEFHTLLLRRDGSLAASGWNTVGQGSIPDGLSNVVAIACGADHNLALDRIGRVTAWGWNRDGQSTVPPGLLRAVAIAGGGFHSLAVRANRTVVAWGRRLEGQCDVPTDLDQVIAVAAGARHSLALRVDGRVIAWGANEAGQCDVPPELTDAVEISAGAFFSLARRANGTVVGWGETDAGQSTPPAGLTDVVQIAAGEFHALALKADGTVVGWGDDTYLTATIPGSLSNVVAVAAGGYHSQALVQTLPPLSRPRLEQGRFKLELNLPAGRRYRLESSVDLNHWTSLGIETVVPGAMTLEPAPANGSLPGSAFYRARLVP